MCVVQGFSPLDGHPVAGAVYCPGYSYIPVYLSTVNTVYYILRNYISKKLAEYQSLDQTASSKNRLNLRVASIEQRFFMKTIPYAQDIGLYGELIHRKEDESDREDQSTLIETVR